MQGRKQHISCSETEAKTLLHPSLAAPLQPPLQVLGISTGARVLPESRGSPLLREALAGPQRGVPHEPKNPQMAAPEQQEPGMASEMILAPS